MNILSGIKMTWDLGALIKGVDAQIHQIYNDNKNLSEKKYTKYLNVLSGDGARYNVKNISGASVLKSVAENGKLQELNTYLGAETSFIFKKFGWIITFTSEAIEDNAYASEMEAVKILAVTGDATKEVHAAEMLRTGWSTTSNTEFPISKPTGVSRLFSIAHTLANGDTFSNTLANSNPLSADALKDMKKMLMEQKADDGKSMRSSGKLILIVSPANEDLAMRIVNSDLRQGTNNNDINTLKWIEVVVEPQLSSVFGGNDTSYFLTDKGMSKLSLVNRKDFTLETSPDFETKNLRASIDGRWAVGFSDVRGIIGSKWDGSTISI